MEDVLIALGFIVAAALLVIPIVALAFAIGARSRLKVLEAENEQRKKELRYLYDRLEEEKKERAALEGAARARPADAARAASAGARGPAEPWRATFERAPEPFAQRTSKEELGRAEAARVEGATEPSAPASVGLDLGGAPEATVPTGDTAPTTPAGHPEVPEASEFPEPSADKTPPPRRVGWTPPPPPAPLPPPVPLEQRLATLFTRIGAGALLLGVLYFYKYAVDNEWIGPAGRVALGALVGLFVLGLAEGVRAKTKPAFVHALVGVGLAFLYITAYASSAFYHLVDTSAAFGANVVILMLGAALAWRHRGEAVLVLVLVAGFLNPVLLSTGEDRPFALFTYLLVLTSVTHFVSAKRHFRVSLWLGIAGVAVLFIGWYGKFFEVFDHRGAEWAGDRPLSELVGAYHELGARAVPLTFLALFTAEWLILAFLLRSQGSSPEGDAEPDVEPSRSTKPVAVAAFLLSHAGAAALLYDHVHVLGGTMIALAVLAVLVLRTLDATRFLLVPMLAAFALLAGLTAELHDRDHVLLLGLLGLWSAVYVAAFLKDVSDANQQIDPPDAIRASVAVAAFAVLATIVLFPAHRFYTLGAVLAAVALVVTVVAGRAKLTWLAFVALLFGLLPWVAATSELPERGAYVDYPFIGLAALWWAVYVVSVTRDAWTGRERRWSALLTLALSGLAFLAIGLGATTEETPTLRALITALVGIVDLAVAAVLARAPAAAPATGDTDGERTSDLRPWVTILSALALGLFAPAVAFGLSGATITVAWALLAVVAIFILGESREPVWLAASVALVVLTISRTFAIDLEGVDQKLRLFELTFGRSGVLAVRAFLNPRGYALLSTGASLLAGAFLLGRAAKEVRDRGVSSKQLLTLAPILATVGYALLTAMVIIEVRTALLVLPPPPPMPLDAQEFSIFMQTVHDARSAHHNLLAMTTTVILALVAMTLLGIGFAAKDPFHRYLGLALFLGTVGKLVFWDIWNLPRLYQVVVLTIVGALLLGSGFLYARLKALFRGDATTTVATILLVLLASQPARAADDPTRPRPPLVKVGRYAHVAQLGGIDGPGDYELPVGLELYRASLAAATLEDVRVADAEGREVPSVVRLVPAAEDSSSVSGTVFDPGTTGDGGARATFEVPEGTEHCEVTLELDRGGSFLRRARIETATKPNDFQVVSDGGLVYSVYFDGGSAEGKTLRYPRSIARYVRVTLHPADGPSVEIRGASFTCLKKSMLPPRDRVPLTILSKTQDANAKTTIIDLDAGAEGVPIDRLHVTAGPAEFVRRVQVLASSYKNAWPPVGQGVLYRVDGGPESLVLDLQETRKRWLRLVIQDGDDAPIDVTAIEGSMPARTLLLRPRAGGVHTLYVGDKEGHAARYDLGELLARRPAELATKPATLAAVAANPSFGKDEVPAELPVTERYRKPIGVALSVLLAGLAFWAVRLLRPAKA